MRWSEGTSSRGYFRVPLLDQSPKTQQLRTPVIGCNDSWHKLRPLVQAVLLQLLLIPNWLGAVWQFIAILTNRGIQSVHKAQRSKHVRKSGLWNVYHDAPWQEQKELAPTLPILTALV